MQSVKTINMLTLRQKPGEIINTVFYQKQNIKLRRGKKDMAMIIPIELYNAFMPKDDEIEMYSDERVAEFLEADKLSPELTKKADHLM
jgi:hypothetical protein